MVNKTGGTPRNSVSRVWSSVPRILRQGYIFSQKIIFFPPPPFFKIILFPPSTVQIGWYKYIRFFLIFPLIFFSLLFPPLSPFYSFSPFFFSLLSYFFPQILKSSIFSTPPPPPTGPGGIKWKIYFPVWRTTTVLSCVPRIWDMFHESGVIAKLALAVRIYFMNIKFY